MDLNEKVVLVTGGGSGIGASTAHHFAKLGAKVAIVDINEKQLNEVADKIIKAGFKSPLPIVADVTKDADRIISETINRFSQLDVLVNCAGIPGIDSIVDFDEKLYDRILNTNLRSMIVLTNRAVPHLEKTKGNVVNVSSVLGMVPYDSSMSYAISKAGVNQFTKCAALSLASKGIRVNAINPGVVETPIYSVVGAKGMEFFEKHKHRHLVNRIGQTSDISAGIVYLATQSFVNGILLPVDGGFLCN